jgi:hypothetical protein
MNRLKLRNWLETNAINLKYTGTVHELLRTATGVFGGDDPARRWLQTRCPALGEEPPAVVAAPFAGRTRACTGPSKPYQLWRYFRMSCAIGNVGSAPGLVRLDFDAIVVSYEDA